MTWVTWMTRVTWVSRETRVTRLTRVTRVTRAREKLIKSLLRERMIFFYHVNRFFTVCLLSVIFT